MKPERGANPCYSCGNSVYNIIREVPEDSRKAEEDCGAEAQTACYDTEPGDGMNNTNVLSVPDSTGRGEGARRTVVVMAAFSLVLWTGLLDMDMPNQGFLTMHTTLEVLSIIMAMLGFGIAWHAYSNERPGSIVILGVVLFGSAVLDFGHLLSYAGMPDVWTPSSAQKSISFWLPARMLMAVGLLVIALRSGRPLANPSTRHWLMTGVMAYVALAYWIVLGRPDALPLFFVPEQGLTDLKVVIEYALVATYCAAALLFYFRAAEELRANSAELFAAAAIAALSELFFTRYARVTDMVNVTGHVYKIASYYFIYKAVFVDSVRQPFEALHRALRQERAHAAEHHSFVRTLDLLEEAVLALDRTGTIISANGGWWRLAGVTPVSSTKLGDYFTQADSKTFELGLFGLWLGKTKEFKGRYRLAVSTDEEQWLECRFVAERDEQDGITGVRGVLRDITKSYQQERHITYMATHDVLTGLPNRVLLEDRVRQAIQRAVRSGEHVGVCFIDLDHFKNINDAYGHKQGDLLLQSIANVLKGCLREGDTLARWGGDEFVVLLPDLKTMDGATLVAEKMVAAMRQPVVLEGMTLSATFSMGISVYPDDEGSGDIESLLAHADRAMFYAKAQGRNNVQLYTEITSKGYGKQELFMQTQLSRAIHEDQITVWFQPQVRLAADRSEAEPPRLVGVEALARWHDEELGWVSPMVFIPMAEHLGLIGELGDQVRRKALSHFSAWRAVHPDLTLSINISMRQLFAADFVQRLTEDLARYSLPPGALVLEVTESVAVMDVDFAEARLRDLSAAGFALSIDDFGTGYASLSQLHELPIGEVKIDISFVRRVHTAEGLRMAQGIVGMAHALQLRTVAEGVEDERTARVMQDIGVDLMQGNYFARPGPSGELLSLPLFAGRQSSPQ
ncbi:MAG: EAL domain-containing protein [Hylemonella sp.]|nr:EAL domain-containing protein [Hylemonella sp.]